MNKIIFAVVLTCLASPFATAEDKPLPGDFQQQQASPQASAASKRAGTTTGEASKPSTKSGVASAKAGKKSRKAERSLDRRKKSASKPGRVAKSKVIRSAHSKAGTKKPKRAKK